METHEKYSPDEITLKELILKIIEFKNEVFSKGLFVLVFCLISIGLALYLRYTAPNIYSAQVSYMLHESAAGGGNIGGLLGNFGIGGRQSSSNLSKLVELSKTEKILRSVLNDSCSIDNKKDLISNHLINQYDFYNNQWSKSSLGSDEFKFNAQSKTSNDLKTNSAYKSIVGRILGGKNYASLITTSFNDETGILKTTANTNNAELSIALATKLFANLDSFYVQNTTEKEQLNLDILQAKTDSLWTEIRSSEYSLATYKDNSLRLLRKTDQIKEVQLSNKIRMLYAALGKATGNLEMADYALKHQTPFLQTIDIPYLPLTSSKGSLYKTLGLALALGLFLSIFIIIARKVYYDIMSEN